MSLTQSKDAKKGKYLWPCSKTCFFRVWNVTQCIIWPSTPILLKFWKETLICQAFALLLTGLALRANPQLSPDSYHSTELVFVAHDGHSLGPLCWCLFLWCQMVGLTYNTEPSPSVSCTLLPKPFWWELDVQSVLVDVAARCTDCSFNWSPEPTPSLSLLHPKPVTPLASVLLSSAIFLRCSHSLAICCQNWVKCIPADMGEYCLLSGVIKLKIV